MKRYKLLKDLPTFKAGDEFVLRDNGCLYLNKVDAVNGYLTGVGHWKNDVMAYHKRTLEQFPNILEDWFEEIEGSKVFWYIDDFMIMCGIEGELTEPNLATFTRRGIERLKAIGNYFETKEEAELAVRRLKAWKRLKDKGFKFCDGDDARISYRFDKKGWDLQVLQDFELLFKGEE